MFTFEIPKTSPAFGILEFALHVLDHSPVYETRAQMRNGYKAIDAIEAAIKAEATSVSMDNEIGKLFQSAVDRAPIPRLHIVVDGKPADPVPARFYAPFYEAVEAGVCTE